MFDDLSNIAEIPSSWVEYEGLEFIGAGILSMITEFALWFSSGSSFGI
ncbi:MAG: hypothetical protein Q4G50_14595 [Corynebacterium sp.]|nr:hypothetical protein [Corynebacterium sp.]MDO5671217.1 hypothetical protein [Corynebacterium sp.]